MLPEAEYPEILVSLKQSEAEYTLGCLLAPTFWKGEQGFPWF